MEKNKWLLLTISILLGIGIFIASQGSSDVMQQETKSLRTVTTPPGSQLLSRSNILKEQYAARVFWEFSTDWKWDDYKPWVEKELGFQWKQTSQSDQALLFQRQLTNDTLSLRIERLGDGGLMRIRVALVGTPAD